MVDEKLMAAITAAVSAYIDADRREAGRRFGQKLNPWKMATRRETMSRRMLTVRGNPVTMRLNRFSLL